MTIRGNLAGMTICRNVVVVPGVAVMPGVAVVLAVVALLALAAPARAIDLNGYRAQHGRPPLQFSAALAAAAQAHAYDLARRGRLDHKGWRTRLGGGATTAAENVSYGCSNVDCAIRQWARSPGHRRNMLMGGVSSYGIGSAVDARGRRYWVLELGH